MAYKNNSFNEKDKECLGKIVKEANFTVIDGIVNFYWNGLYIPFSKTQMDAFILPYVFDYRTRKDMVEQVRSHIQRSLMTNELPKHSVDSDDSRYIAFQNGIYDLDTNQLVDFSTDIFVQNKLPMNYNPTADTSFVTNALEVWANHDESRALLLQEILGAAITVNRKLFKSFILLGRNTNGKSDFLDTVKLLVGEENSSSLNLKDFKNETRCMELYSKLVNCGDEECDATIKDTSMFKRIVSQNPIYARKLYEMSVQFKPRSTLLFSANVLPNFVDRTGDIQKRLVVVPFENFLTADNPDTIDGFLNEMMSPNNIEALALVALEGLKRLRANKYHYTSEQSSVDWKTVEDENKPVLYYLRNVICVEEVLGRPVEDVYNEYTQWNERENKQLVSKNAFGRAIHQEYGVTSETVGLKTDDKKYKTIKIYK